MNFLFVEIVLKTSMNQQMLWLLTSCTAFAMHRTLIFSVVYLRKIVNGKAHVVFISGKSRLVLTQQANWLISRFTS